MHLKRILEPTEEPISLSQAKTQCRITSSDFDTELNELIQQARHQYELDTNRTMLETTYQLSLDRWPKSGILHFPRSPLLDIDSMVYVNKDNTEVELTDSSGSFDVTFQTDTNNLPGRMALQADKEFFELSTIALSPIRITYTAGYGTQTSDVEPIDQTAIKLLVAYYFYQMRNLGVCQDTKIHWNSYMAIVNSRKIWSLEPEDVM